MSTDELARFILTAGISSSVSTYPAKPGRVVNYTTVSVNGAALVVGREVLLDTQTDFVDVIR